MPPSWSIAISGVDEVGVARDLLEALVDRAGLGAGRRVLDEDDAAGPQVAQGRPGLLGGAPDPGEQQQLADPVLVGGEAAHRLGDGLLVRRGRRRRRAGRGRRRPGPGGRCGRGARRGLPDEERARCRPARPGLAAVRQPPAAGAGRLADRRRRGDERGAAGAGRRVDAWRGRALHVEVVGVGPSPCFPTVNTPGVGRAGVGVGSGARATPGRSPRSERTTTSAPIATRLSASTTMPDHQPGRDRRSALRPVPLAELCLRLHCVAPWA